MSLLAQSQSEENASRHKTGQIRLRFDFEFTANSQLRQTFLIHQLSIAGVSHLGGRGERK